MHLYCRGKYGYHYLSKLVSVVVLSIWSLHGPFNSRRPQRTIPVNHSLTDNADPKIPRGLIRYGSYSHLDRGLGRRVVCRVSPGSVGPSCHAYSVFPPTVMFEMSLRLSGAVLSKSPTPRLSLYSAFLSPSLRIRCAIPDLAQYSTEPHSPAPYRSSMSKHPTTQGWLPTPSSSAGRTGRIRRS